MKKTIAEMEQTAASEAANKLISLFDEDSFVELGKFVGANGEKTVTDMLTEQSYMRTLRTQALTQVR